ncbi:hypothetical protein LCGC14_2600290 [marine sediment metagenome]|uniref:Uncharacterized protein n=1 Tax=marine sediment metagenome TaxID=412755 RepID=A0A0F9A951_9ZZZZ
MKTVRIVLKGLTPLMVHRYPLEGAPADFKQWDALKVATFHLYVHEGTNVMPNENVRKCLIEGGKFVKGKGKSSLMTTLAAGIRNIDPWFIPITPQAWIVDSRSAVNNMMRPPARIVVHRPKWNDWSLLFKIDYYVVLLNEKQIVEALTSAGRNIGIGSFRPRKLGMFGQFEVS